MTKHAPRRLSARLVIFTGFLSLACCATPATESGRCGGFIAPGMRLLTVSAMQASDRDAFLKRAPGSSPGCLVIDLNDDGIDDVALIGQDPQTQAVFLIGALGSRDGAFTTVARERLGTSMEGVFLIKYAGREVATTEALDIPEKTVQLSGAAVELVFVEKAVVVYFWDPKASTLRSVQTAD